MFMTGVERSYASAIELASRDLTVRSEVGSVMEGMLGDLEAWEWANKEEALKTELDHARAQVKALQESEKRLIEVGIPIGGTRPGSFTLVARRFVRCLIEIRTLLPS